MWMGNYQSPAESRNRTKAICKLRYVCGASPVSKASRQADLQGVGDED